MLPSTYLKSSVITEEELRDWVGQGEPDEKKSLLTKDTVLLRMKFTLQMITLSLFEHDTGSYAMHLQQCISPTIDLFHWVVFISF